MDVRRRARPPLILRALHTQKISNFRPSPAQPTAELLPETGALYVEKGPLTEVLCKPKLMPIKSVELVKVEAIERAAAAAAAAAAKTAAK